MEISSRVKVGNCQSPCEVFVWPERKGPGRDQRMPSDLISAICRGRRVRSRWSAPGTRRCTPSRPAGAGSSSTSEAGDGGLAGPLVDRGAPAPPMAADDERNVTIPSRGPRGPSVEAIAATGLLYASCKAGQPGNRAAAASLGVPAYASVTGVGFTTESGPRNSNSTCASSSGACSAWWCPE